MQYEHVELQPIEICTHAACRRSRRDGRSPANSSNVAKCPRGRSRPEREVDERVAREQLVLQRLREAAADGDRPPGVRLLGGARLHQRVDEPLVGLLADRAGVEHDDVRVVLRRRLAEAERLEQALDPLGVVHVHLAAEGGDVVALHGADCRARPVPGTLILAILATSGRKLVPTGATASNRPHGLVTAEAPHFRERRYVRQPQPRQ
jgi:hypothetical protein